MKGAWFGLVCTFFILGILMIGEFPQVQGLTLDNAQTCSSWQYIGPDLSSIETVPVFASTFYVGNTVYLYYTVEDSRAVDLSNDRDFLSNSISFTLTDPSGLIGDNFFTRSLASESRTRVQATDSSPSKTIESAFLEVMNVTSITQNGLWTISGSYEDKSLFTQQFVVDTSRIAPSPSGNLILTTNPTSTDVNYAAITVIALVLTILAALIAFIVIGVRKRNQRLTIPPPPPPPV
jgi:hypothetical protein